MKPPVVVIERHCKTNQCWIAVRFKKIQSVAKISQSAAKGARMTPWQTSSTDGVAEKYFRHACARRSRKFSFSPSPSLFALATGESALTRPSSSAPSIAPHRRSSVASSRSRPMRVESDHDAGLPKRPGPTADYPKERGTPAHHHAREYPHAGVSPICRRSPCRARHRRRSQLPDSLPLSGSETAAPIATSWCNSASTTDRIA